MTSPATIVPTGQGQLATTITGGLNSQPPSPSKPSGITTVTEDYDMGVSSTTLNPCNGIVCENGGTCSNETGGYTCLCATGFSGESCG